MRKLYVIVAAMLMPLAAAAQSYENHYERSFSDVMNELQKTYKVKFKYNVDTAGLRLPYADWRIRAYSIEETLTNICKYYDFNWWKQGEKTYKIKPYEYPRRHVEEGKKMLDYLSTLYSNKEEWEKRRKVLRKEVRERLGIDKLMDSLVKNAKPVLSKVKKYDGYSMQHIRIEMTPGEHVFGTIYAPLTKGKHPLIICPDGHWSPGRERADEQTRLATLARMGAICVDFDLYAWGQSKAEVKNHETSRAHRMQAAYGLRLLNYMLDNRKDIDRSRIGVNGGSGGGTHTILLTMIDDRFTAAAPTVNLASHFDGGCPCESGMPVQRAGGGTCNPEQAACFAPLPMLIVSDGGDWTSSVPELEFPYLQRVYGFYGAQDKVRNVHLANERHDFGPNKRSAVYEFFADVFALDRSKIDESKVTVVDASDFVIK